MSIQVLPDRFGINQALQGLGPVLGQALSNRYANQQKRATAQNVAGLLNRPITSEQDATEFLQGAIGAGLDPREAFGLLDSMLKSRQAFQPDPVADLLGLGEESALQPSMGSDQFQRPDGISGKQRQNVTAPRSKLESLTDGELVTLQSSPNARMRAIGKAEQERRALQSKESRADRDFSYKRAEPQFKKIDKIRGTLPERESALNEIQGALESGALDGWNQNYVASFFGRLGEGFVTPEGAIFQSSIKEYLLNNIGRVGGRPNQWIEQQISSALPNLGKSAEANRAIASMLLAASRRDRAEVGIFDRIVGEYEDAGMPIPLGLDRLVSKELESFERANQKQLALDLAEIKESKLSDEELRKDLLKKVPRGTPITERKARLLDEKYGAKSKAVAKKLGYDVDAPSSDEKAAPKQDVNPEPDSEKAASITPLSDEVQDDELDRAIGAANVPRGTDINPEDNRWSKAVEGSQDLLSKLNQGAGSLISGVAEGVEGQRYFVQDLLDTLFGRETPKMKPFSTIAESILPDIDDSFVNKALQRSGSLLPGLAMGGPGSSALARSAVGGTAGQVAESAGFGPFTQWLFESVGSSLPGLRGLKPTPKQRATYETLKTLGLDDKQIAPILSAKSIDEGGIIKKGLAKFSRKSSSTYKKLGYVQDGLTDGFGKLAQMAENAPVGSDTARKAFNVDLTKMLTKDINANVAQVIAPELARLNQEGISPSSAIRFYRAVNELAKGDNKSLYILKKPVKDYLSKVDPVLAKDFEILNKSYAQFSNFRSIMDPGKIEKVLGNPLVGPGAGVAIGLFSGNPSLLAGTIGVAAARSLAQKMLTDPKYQNISNQMWNAMKRNSISIARSAVTAAKRKLAEDQESEALSALNRLTDEDLKDLLQAD
jgi:hypothetical protein